MLTNPITWIIVFTVVLFVVLALVVVRIILLRKLRRLEEFMEKYYLSERSNNDTT